MSVEDAGLLETILGSGDPRIIRSECVKAVVPTVWAGVLEDLTRPRGVSAEFIHGLRVLRPFYEKATDRPICRHQYVSMDGKEIQVSFTMHRLQSVYAFLVAQPDSLVQGIAHVMDYAVNEVHPLVHKVYYSIA